MRLVAPVILLFAVSAHADGLSGRVKLDAIGYDAGGDTVEAMLDHRTSGELAGELRLEFTRDRGPWNLDAAWQADIRHGSAVRRDTAVAELFPQLALAEPEDGYFDLEDDFTRRDATRGSHRIDRLSVGYARGALVARIGRQALTWGNGLVFHPMDLVNPFQPVATDTAYKRGTDMVYGQWLFEDGSDVQVAAVPREQDDAEPDSGKNTYAGFANIAGERLQWNLLLARDRADSVLGIGASGALGGAAWNVEVIPTWIDGGGRKTSALANISYAATLWERYATLFAEFYHNGFGETGDDYPVTELSPDLLTRLARGQVFVTGRDYLSLGMTWEWTPLLQLAPTLIYNVHDHSALFDMQLNRSLGDDAAFKAGLRLSSGGQGTEFEGLRLLPMLDLYLAEPAQAFARLEYYF